jgi:hypothetical protein
VIPHRGDLEALRVEEREAPLVCRLVEKRGVELLAQHLDEPVGWVDVIRPEGG